MYRDYRGMSFRYETRAKSPQSDYKYQSDSGLTFTMLDAPCIAYTHFSTVLKHLDFYHLELLIFIRGHLRAQANLSDFPTQNGKVARHRAKRNAACQTIYMRVHMFQGQLIGVYFSRRG